MDLGRLSNRLFTICFVIAFGWTSFLFFSWQGGGDVSPVTMMNAFVCMVYSMCLMAFNWPDSTRLVRLRAAGIIYSLVLLVLSLLTVNNIINFSNGWNYVFGGISVSLLMATAFLVYRVRGFDGGPKSLLRSIHIGATALFFALMGYVYMTTPGGESFFDALYIGLIVYSAITIGYFTWVMLTTKADRSKHRK